MAQQQPTTARRETTPVDALQGTMNLLLTVLGQSLNPPSRLREPEQRIKMQRVFPTANLRFHEALDRMEEEINMAQNILKRDLALHRVMEKQKAEKALAPPEPKEIKQEPSPLPVKEPDVVMKEAEPTPASTTRVMEPVISKVETQAPAPSVQPAPIAPMMVAPQVATQTAAAPAPAQSAPEPQPVEPAPAPAPAPTEPAEQPLEEMDFSEFFGDDVMGDADAANANAPDDTQQLEPLADFSTENADADVSSLLPGLGDYANIPDDSAMPDASAAPVSMPETNAQAGDMAVFDFGDLGAVQGNGNAQQNNTQQQINAQPDFGDIDFDFGTGEASGGDGGQQGDNTFNDLFDMDSYDFGGGNGGGGEDINDWMKSL